MKAGSIEAQLQSRKLESDSSKGDAISVVVGRVVDSVVEQLSRNEERYGTRYPGVDGAQPYHYWFKDEPRINWNRADHAASIKLDLRPLNRWLSGSSEHHVSAILEEPLARALASEGIRVESIFRPNGKGTQYYLLLRDMNGPQMNRPSIHW